MAYQPSLVNAQAIIVEEKKWYYLFHSWEGYEILYQFQGY